MSMSDPTPSIPTSETPQNPVNEEQQRLNSFYQTDPSNVYIRIRGSNEAIPIDLRHVPDFSVVENALFGEISIDIWWHMLVSDIYSDSVVFPDMF